MHKDRFQAAGAASHDPSAPSSAEGAASLVVAAARADRGEAPAAAPVDGAAPVPSARRDSVTAIGLMVVVCLLMQTGSSLAVKVIGSVGAMEAVWIRTVFAAVLLCAVRPRYIRFPAKGDRMILAFLVISLAGMNFTFYQAIGRAPVGIVVAVEFLGPFTIAIVGSRRLLDGVWVVLAAAGVALLAGPAGAVRVLGLVFALAAAACWASFILLAKRAVGRMEPFRVTTLMFIGASVLLTPFFLASGPRVRGHGGAILLGLGVAVISSALPYILELAAIKRVRAATYGILISIEPAIAAILGFAILGQSLNAKEIGAIAAIITAAAGASWASAAARPAPQDGDRGDRGPCANRCSGKGPGRAGEQVDRGAALPPTDH
jgi:inner membrane transporter RhtA